VVKYVKNIYCISRKRRSSQRWYISFRSFNKWNIT